MSSVQFSVWKLYRLDFLRLKAFKLLVSTEQKNYYSAKQFIYFLKINLVERNTSKEVGRWKQRTIEWQV